MPEPVVRVVGKAAPLEADDVDTDQIIPAEFLKVIERKGLGKYLFYRWRYDEKGMLRGDFVLDRPEFRDAKILVAGRNFGIGSSRENAVWALTDFGIKCVVASGFGDIFYGNASKNGLVCIKLSDENVSKMRNLAKTGNLQVAVDLESQTITYAGETISFTIEPHIRERLMKGLDDIQITIEKYSQKIAEHESRMPEYLKPKPRGIIVE
ncbi:MAG: 3-isopropylmalate dehydratase small subunit [Candidatus Caldarchaeum sp.]|nr:3-isopropylmalate dehydratase small subunit [Candidatus Caldarchaeum sp.]MCX8200771.1 3-isopropylmalate dehydratase small subunit [Candidatus Caldarchaeum sp.]MDW8435383.1 3-isopropylmalate dehydratase small subunit [Candidatus Caldarchaeum sp.]